MGDIINFQTKKITEPTGEQRIDVIHNACYQAYYEASALKGQQTVNWGTFLDEIQIKCRQNGISQFTDEDEAIAFVYARKTFLQIPDNSSPQILT